MIVLDWANLSMPQFLCEANVLLVAIHRDTSKAQLVNFNSAGVFVSTKDVASASAPHFFRGALRPRPSL